MQHLSFVLIIDIIAGLAPPAALGADEVEILRNEAGHFGEKVAGFGCSKWPAVMRHDIVKVDLDPETVRGPDQRKEVFLGAISCRDRSRLLDVAEVKAVEGIEAHREGSGSSLEWWWEPERGISGFSDLRDALFDSFPAGAEVLQDRFLRMRERSQCKKDRRQRVQVSES